MSYQSNLSFLDSLNLNLTNTEPVAQPVTKTKPKSYPQLIPICGLVALDFLYTLLYSISIT